MNDWLNDWIDERMFNYTPTKTHSPQNKQKQNNQKAIKQTIQNISFP